MFRTTLKNLAARKLRLVTTSLAVLLGVAFMAGTLVLTDTIGASFDRLFASANAGTDVQVRHEAAFEDKEMGAQRARVDLSLADRLAKVDGVATAEGYTLTYAQVVGRDGKPDAGAHHQKLTRDVERCSEGLGDPTRHPMGVLGFSLDHHGELVTTHTGHGVADSDTVDEPVRRRFEQHVARRMPHAVVDEFEIVEVQRQHRDRAPIAAMQLHGVRQPLVEQRSVRQAGQRVAQCLIRHHA